MNNRRLFSLPLSTSTRCRAALTALATIISVPALHAASGSWNVDAAGNWSTAASWNPAAVPGTTAGDVINFTNNISAARTITIDTTSRTAGDLNIGDSAATLFSFTLASTGGGALLLDGTGSTAATVDFVAGVANTISAPISLVDNAIFRSNVAFVQTLSGVISGASRTVTFNNDTNGTVNAATALQGQFALSAANSYTGGTTISDVRVSASNPASFGTGGVTIQSGGQAFAASAITITNAFNIAGNGWAETAGGQPFGALRLDSGAAVSGNVVMSANAAIGSNTGVGTVSGVISGPSFALTKRGPGTIVLSAANTYGGGTTIGNGILQLNSNTAAGPGTISLIAGGSGGTRLQLNGGVTISNPISATAVTGAAGTGVIQQTGTGLATVNGTINITGGPSAGGHFVGGASVGNALVLNGVITATVGLTQRDGFVRYSGGGTGYNSLGITNTAQLGATNGLSTLTQLALGLSGAATFDLNGFNQTLAGISKGPQAGTIGNSSTTTDSVLTTTGVSTYAGNIQNTVLTGTRSLALTVAGGALTLSGTSTYTGPTNVTAGTLAVTRTLALAPTSPLTVASGAAFNYLPATVGALAMGSGTYTFAGGSSIQSALGGNAGESAINFPGAVSTAGAITVNVFQIPGAPLTLGSNDLITALSGLSGATYTLGTVYNTPDFTLGGLTSSDTAVSITATSATPITTAFWKGGLAGAPSVWAASNGSTASNWVTTSGGVDQSLTPNSGTDVTISNSAIATSPASTTLGANLSINSLTISDTTNGLGLNADGNTLTVGAGGITVSASVPASTIAPNVILSSNQTWTNDSANSLTISGAVSGAGISVTKAGTGTVILSGANTYSGTTSVNNGTLRLSGGNLATSAISIASNASYVQTAGAATGMSTLTVAGGATFTLSGGSIAGPSIAVASGATFTQSGGSIASTGMSVDTGAVFNQTAGSISGAGTFVSSGTSTLLGTNSFTGDVTLNGGSLTVAQGNGVTGSLGSSTAPATLSKTVTLTNNAILRSTATYNDNVGSATVLQVVFNIGTGGATFDIASGTTTTLDDGSLAGNANNAAQLQGTGDLTKIGPGTLSLGNGTSNFGTFTGQIFVNEGTLTTGATSTNPFGDTAAGTIIASGAVLDVKGAAIGLEPITVSGSGIAGGGALISNTLGGSAAGPITLAGDTSIGGATALTLSGVISGGFSLTKVGAGTTTLSNPANTYSGSTTVAAGTLTPGVAGAIPVGTDLIFTGGTFDPANLTTTVASISGATGSINQVTAGTGVVRTTQSGATVFNGTVNRVNVTMAGTGSLTLGGTVDNVAANATVNSGTLILAKGNTAPALQAVHAVATGGLTINGGTVQLAGTYDNFGTPGTGVNLAPVGIDPATYGDLIYNAVGVALNAGTLDMNGRQEAINTLSNPAGAGGTVTNTATDPAKLFIGHQNGTSAFAGAITDGAGTVSIEKIGTGTLTLTGANTYSGTTVVTAGRLNAQSNLVNSDVTLGFGASLGGESVMANLTLNGGTLFFDPTTPAALTTGVLTVNGANTLDLTSLPLAGTVTAINYGSNIGGGTFSLANAGSYRVTPTITDTGSAIQLTFAAGKNLTWTGSASSGWNVNADINWLDTAPAPDVFFSSDTVTFSEGGSNTSITLTGLLAPAGVIVNAASTAYTFTASPGNQIVGPTGITKTGNGTLTLNGANAYAGPTNIGGGVVEIDGTNSIGGGGVGNSIALSGGGRLRYTTAAALDLGVTRSISVGAGGGAIAYNSPVAAAITVPGSLIGSGTDNLSFQSEAAGVGTFILTGNNAGYTGKISIDGPTVGNGGLTVLRIANQSAAPGGGSITLNYPAAATTTTAGNPVTLDLAGVALPAGVTLNMTSFQNGGISLRSSLTSSGASSINGTLTAEGFGSIIQLSPAAGSTLTLNGPIVETGSGFTGTFFIRGNITNGVPALGVVNGQVNLPNASFAKTDTGSWTVNSSGNIWAQTNIAVGTVVLGTNDAFATAAPLSLGQNDTNVVVLNLNGFNQTVASLATNPVAPGANTTGKSITSAAPATLTVNTNSVTTYAGAFTGQASLTKDGAGILTLAGTSTTSGTMTISGGTLNVIANTAIGALSSPVVINNNAILQAGGALTTTARTITLGAGGGMIDTNSNVVTLGAGSTVTGTTLTKIGAGKLVLAGTQTYATLDTEAGRTDIASALGTGTSSLIANAETNISVSQTLAALNIGDGAVVTLGSPLPPAPAFAEEFGGAALEIGGGELTGTPIQGVPEPGSVALVLGGVLALLGRRRRA